MLPFQLIYRGKTERSLPSYDFPEGFSLSFNEKHWSNEIETIRLIDEILLAYIEKVKKEHNFPDHQKSLLIWDAFQAQSTTTVMEKVPSHCIQSVGTSKHDSFITTVGPYNQKAWETFV